MAKRDYYEVLGVAENATQDQIKKAFRTLAKKYHPDANRNDPSAEARFKEAGEAFDVLGDPTKRQQYDQMKRYGGRPGGFPGGGFPGGFPGGGFPDGFPGGPDGGTFRGQTIDLSDLFGGGGGRGMGDIFEHLFGGRFRQAEEPEAERDIEVALDVPAKVAEKGGFAKFAVQRRGPCRTCDGSGAAPGHPPKDCSTCGGRGTVVQNRGGFSVSRTCPACYGRGQVIDKPCPACHGEGLRFDERRLRVKIPAGARPGQKLRLRGQGHAGSAGEPAGDLIVTLNVLADTADNAKKSGA
jgi:molecular chaperone DnaJ